MKRAGIACVGALVSLVACETGVRAPSYPRTKCADVHDAKMNPALYVVDDWRDTLFADDRDAWGSSRCDALRSALAPLDTAHDLEDETVQRDCDSASSHVDVPIRLACRAGCFAERRYRVHVAAWARALAGVAAFAPDKLDVTRVAAQCAALHVAPPPADRARVLWTCAHSPLPPKRFRLQWQNRFEYVHSHDAHGHEVTSTQEIGFESMSATMDEGERRRTVTLEECGGSSSHWGVFEWEQ